MPRSHTKMHLKSAPQKLNFIMGKAISKSFYRILQESVCLISCIIFEEKYFSGYILLGDQISLPGCPYFVRYETYNNCFWGQYRRILTDVKVLSDLVRAILDGGQYSKVLPSETVIIGLLLPGWEGNANIRDICEMSLVESYVIAGNILRYCPLL